MLASMVGAKSLLPIERLLEVGDRITTEDNQDDPPEIALPRVSMTSAVEENCPTSSGSSFRCGSFRQVRPTCLPA
jgi:hypothetical protein